MHRIKIIVLSLLVIFCPQAVEAQSIFPFKGEIDFLNSRIQSVFRLSDGGSVTVSVRKSTANHFGFSISVEQMALPAFTVSTVLDGTVMFHENSKGEKAFSGKVRSDYSLVNGKPIKEMAGNFDFKNDKLSLNYVSVGNVVCRGTIDLSEEIKMDLVFELTDVEMEDFLAFWTNGKAIPSSGLVSGDIKVLGELKRLALKGQLSSFDGHVKELAFDHMQFNVEGVYPIISLYNSSITETSGLSFAVEGDLDLAKRDDFKKQIRMLAKSALISDTDSSFAWTLKRAQDGNNDRSTELKYMLKKRTALDINDPEDDGMFGVEKKIQF